MSLFEQAARLKLRFESRQGNLTVEDLWDLPLKSDRKASLEEVGATLLERIEAGTKTKSLVDDTPGVAAEDTLALDIVKHIIATRKTENAAAAEKEERKATRQRIAELIEKKKGEALEGKSLEELETELAKL